MFELCVESQFDSAHNLRKYQGPCENLHGHTYKVQVFVRGSQLNEMGMLIDFRRIKTALSEVISYLDHRYLNELPEFQEQNPTAEIIAKVVFEKMRLQLGEIVHKVIIWESPTSSACYSEEA